MKRVLLSLAILFSIVAFANSPRSSMHSSLVDLASASKAKQMCSCLFVMNQTEKFCDRYSIPDKYLDWIDSTEINNDKKMVTATVGFFWQSTAKYVGDKKGCQLQSI